MDYQQSNNGNKGNSGGKQWEDKSFVPNPVPIKTFYKEDGKTILPDLFDTKANEVAASFIGKNRSGKDMGVTSTQLRRIFDVVKRFEQILSASPEQWDSQYPYIRMIKSKVAYTVARAAKDKSEEAGVYKNLEKFISSCIDLIHNKFDYDVFLALFEAAYGFYYEKAPKSITK
ncbi:MAG: type III-A CRISPR-associated protein Csm2 [Treponema sp.]|nr:type III-A CRISPR-associated protein Csm2 [Treponema sp.]